MELQDYTKEEITISIDTESAGENKVNVIETKYQINDGDINVYEGPFKVSENCKITAWFELNTGGQSASDILVVDNIDKQNPSITVQSNEAGINLSNETIDSNQYKVTSANSVLVLASDAISGMRSISYKYNGSAPVQVGKDNAVISSRGTYEVIATDNAGNTASAFVKLVDEPSVYTSPNLENGEITNRDVVVTGNGEGVSTLTVTKTVGGATTTTEETSPYNLTHRNNDFFGILEKLQII